MNATSDRIIEKDNPFRECGVCRYWWPDTLEQLCQYGTCYREAKGKSKKRIEVCDNWEEDDGR